MKRILGLALVVALVVLGCGDSGDEGGTSGTQSDLTLGTIGDIPGLSGECEALAEFLFGISQTFVTGRNAQDLIEAARGGLPSSLHDELDTVAAAATGYSDLLREYDVDLIDDPNSFSRLSPEQQNALAEATEEFSSPEVDAAMETLTNYGEQECALGS